jgi:tetratricopeptide (TPR) repeat protein
LLKENAAKDFKAKDYNSACDKYYKVISVVRSNEKLKSTSQGKDICTTSRLNIALCKFTTKQYDEAIDQCERVLDTEPKNWKASFRLARSNENSSETELKTICNYAKKALDGNPNDAKVKEFYTKVTEK